MVKKNFEKICIIGMPGSGKSTIGRALSDYLKFDFYDTDEQIEIESQSKIKNIFNKEGEEHFRKLERSIFKKLQTFNIYLKCDLETLIKRTSRNKNRPLLKNNVEKNIKILFNDRKEIYNKSSDFTINASSNTQKTIKTILEHLK